MKASKETESFTLPRPDEIKDYLDQYVIGQEEAKKVLSVAVYNHYKKLCLNKGNNAVEIDKSNIILGGETGSGKTLLVKTIAKMLGVPYHIQDCTKITASGYVGSDVEDCLVGLLRNCNYDVKRAEMGIVMLDEGDKIAKKGENVSITRDVSGECVQQSLLKIVEGDKVGVPPMGGRKNPMQECIYIDTTNILFILSGAFVGLEDIIKSRMGSKTIGFSSENTAKEKEDNIIKYTTPDDLRKFGLIPEFVGRFPVFTYVNKLEVDDLVTILTEPKNSLVKQYKRLLDMDNVSLKFDKEALTEIAKMAHTFGTGARGLRSIIETIMIDIMFELPKAAMEKDKKLKYVVTRDIVLEKTAAVYKKAQ